MFVPPDDRHDTPDQINWSDSVAIKNLRLLMFCYTELDKIYSGLDPEESRLFVRL